MPSKNSLINVKVKDPILSNESNNEPEPTKPNIKTKKENVSVRVQLLLTPKENAILEDKAGIAGVAAYLRNEIRTKTDFLEDKNQ